jgi:ribosomal-protein-alanine N-acetyltransferase
VVYRLYRGEDFSQLYAIELECFRPPFRFARGYMRQLIESPDSATWIAEEQGRMTGFAIVVWIPDPEQTIAYIQTLEVAPEHRRRGIGKRLLRQLEISARNAGAEAVWLHVAEQNPSAIRLYQAQGYFPQGREEDYYAPGVDALTYARALPKSRSTPRLKRRAA